MELDPEALGWGIVGVGLLPADRRMIDSLAPQDGLYTLIEREGADETVRVIGSLARLIFAGETSAELLAALDDPALRILSLTVTENGYCLDPATKRLNPSTSSSEPTRDTRAAAQRHRRDRRGAEAPAPCRDGAVHRAELRQHPGNGAVLRHAVLALAACQDDKPGLPTGSPKRSASRAPWSTASRRSRPQPTSRGLRPAWPCRPLAGRLRDLHPMGHRGPLPARAAGLGEGRRAVRRRRRALRVHEAPAPQREPSRRFGTRPARRLCDDRRGDGRSADRGRHEGPDGTRDGPDAAACAGYRTAAYKRTLVDRFANPAIRDTVDRVNADAPLNVLLDPIRSRLAQANLDFLALALAAWLRRVRGEDERGATIPVRHPLAELLAPRPSRGPDPGPLLGIRPLFGELGADARFSSSPSGTGFTAYTASASRRRSTKLPVVAPS